MEWRLIDEIGNVEEHFHSLSSEYFSLRPEMCPQNLHLRANYSRLGFLCVRVVFNLLGIIERRTEDREASRCRQKIKKNNNRGTVLRTAAKIGAPQTDTIQNVS